MPNKFFNVKNPSQIVTITEDKDKFYELSDGNMIKKDTFMQKYQPVLDDINEGTSTHTQTGPNALDPESFFNATSISDDVVNGIKQADPSKAPIDGQNRTEVVHKGAGQNDRTGQNMGNTHNESLVTRIDDQVIPNNTNTDVSQYKVYENEDEAYADFIKKGGGAKQPQKPQQSDIEKKKMEIEELFLDEKMTFGEEEAIARRSKRLLRLPAANAEPQVETEMAAPNAEYHEPQSPQQQISPIEMMFSTFKRKHPITINVEFEDMIGEPDFIKLMVENMDGDIVGYYKKKVMENIMGDLSKIEQAVEEKIKSEIFGETVTLNFKPDAELIKKIKDANEVVLIPGGTTKTGKQKYKYVDENGNVKELLPASAKTKGYEPYKEG